MNVKTDAVWSSGDTPVMSPCSEESHVLRPSGLRDS